MLDQEKKIQQWIQHVIHKEGHNVGEINYVFCDDAYLNNINVKYLQHDTFTDIISFDYTVGKIINGDIFISVERVKENSLKYNVTFVNEILRVMIHGVLHYLGYKDKTEEQTLFMRVKEDECISLISL
jgi:rRNA maturation RNase YbeY